MKYEVELPADVERRLSDKASRTGEDVVHLIRIAVVRFVNDETRETANGSWSNEFEARRCELIDKDIAGTASIAEQAELLDLDKRANEYFDKTAAPPVEGARRLHQQLLKNRGSRQ